MKIGFIGTGNMGTAIMKGYLASHPGAEQSIYAYDKDSEKLSLLSKELGIQGCGSIEQLVDINDVIVLAVKPNVFEVILPEISAVYRPDKVIVSIAAGVSIGFIEKYIGNDGVKVVRVMPNTPAMVNEGMTAVCRNKNIMNQEFEPVIDLFRSIGRAEVVDESLIDTVTGVSGSSPAYTYMYIEALIDGAVKNGMSKEQAKIFAAQSVLGAAKMVLETGVDPVTLRVNVCSPGGTTIEAVNALQNNGFHDNVVEALDAVVVKSKLMTK
jgi:pyrroline-5-carboxylate reductase